MKKFLMVLWVAATLSLYACKPKDADIQSAVQTAITAVAGVNANVTKGEVTLTGTVASEEAKAKAEELAKAVKGVKGIVNSIEVVLPIIANDDVLSTGLKTALAAFSTVTGEVKDSVITLKGEVMRSDLAKVMEAVQALRPKKVENQLTIK